MKNAILMISIFIIFSPHRLFAQETQSPSGKKTLSEENDIWQQISEIRKEKDLVYKTYQKDKEDLELKFQESMEDIVETGADDMFKQQILLEKEFRKQKVKLLKAYRRDNWALEKKANALKGRKTIVTSEMQTRQRLQNSSDFDSTQGVKK